MIIRKAGENDTEGLWEIFKEVIKTGTTYVFDPNTPKEFFKSYWFAPQNAVYVAEEDGQLLGTYILRPNQVDLGSHIANGAYMVHPASQGKAVGKRMCEHSIIEAKRLGYLAMQFNIVVSTNEPAVRLWKSYGFEIIGTIPQGFNHRELGLVDAYIMFKKL